MPHTFVTAQSQQRQICMKNASARSGHYPHIPLSGAGQVSSWPALLPVTAGGYTVRRSMG